MDETVLRGYTAVWQNMPTGIADDTCHRVDLLLACGQSGILSWTLRWDRTLVSKGVKTTKIVVTDGLRFDPPPC